MSSVWPTNMLHVFTVNSQLMCYHRSTGRLAATYDSEHTGRERELTVSFQLLLTFFFLPVNSYSPYNTSYQLYLLDRIGPKGKGLSAQQPKRIYRSTTSLQRVYILRTSSDKAPVSRACVSLGVSVYVYQPCDGDSRTNRVDEHHVMP